MTPCCPRRSPASCWITWCRGGAGSAEPAPPPGYRSLTEREAEVFGLLALGRSNTEIARSLGVSDETVKTHVSRVLAKLGARDRVQAVVLAHRCGLVPQQPR